MTRAVFLPWSGIPQMVRACSGTPGGEGRRGEMTALVWVLVVAFVVLAALVVAGLVLGARAMRRLQTGSGEQGRGQAVDDALAKVEDANAKVEDANAKVDDANATAASVRAEAAAAT